jgi:uncharacterized membrane protein (DUF2068 family)
MIDTVRDRHDRGVDWSLRGCARHGHDTYAPDEPELATRLHAPTPLGDAWRCLRCGAYVLGEPAGRGPAELAPAPLRGKAARDAVIVRLLAAERAVRGVLVLLAAYVVVRFEHSQDSLRSLLDRAVPAARPLAAVLHVDLDHSATLEHLRHLVNTRPHTLTLVAIGLVVYAAIELVEAIGLWQLKRWGEYVAVVATVAFVPLEGYEVIEKTSWLKAVTLVLNIAAVIWLVWSKRLFGARGGHAAYEADRHEESLLDVELAAELVPARSEEPDPVS